MILFYTHYNFDSRDNKIRGLCTKDRNITINFRVRHVRQVHEKYISAKCGSLKELNESQDISLGISKCIKSYIKFLQILKKLMYQ